MLLVKENILTLQVKYLVISIPILTYFLFVNHYALNLPYHDDYLAILDFLNHFAVADAKKRAVLLISQHNEHRLLSARAIYAAFFLVTGHINFRVLIFIANIQLVGIFLILLHFIIKISKENWFWPGLILSLSLFDISGYDNMLWAMAGMSNIGIVFLFLASLYFYSLSNNKYVAVAFAIQAIATFSNGNGIIASFFLMLFALCSGNKTKIISGIMCFAIFVPLYFFHYNRSQGGHTINSIGKIILGIYSFTGGHFTFSRQKYGFYMFRLASFAMIVVMAVSFPYKKNLREYAKYLPLLATSGFIYGTFATVSLYRYSISYTASRYIIYPAILFSIVSFFLLHKFNIGVIGKRILYFCMAVTCISYSLNTFNCFPQMLSNRSILLNREYNIGGGIWEPTDSVHGKAISDLSCRLNIYCQGNERIKYQFLTTSYKH